MTIRKHLPEKPSLPLSKFEIFDKYFEELYQLRKEKYSYIELNNAFMLEAGISLSNLTFRDYFNISRRKRNLEIIKLKGEKK